MNHLYKNAAILARLLVATVFLLNGFGVIDQGVPLKELAATGVPVGLASMMVMGGRGLQIIAGLALVFGAYTQFAALALFAFLIPATLTAHAFWKAAGTPAFQGQLVNFSKNLAMMGGLLFIAAREAIGETPWRKPISSLSPQ
jgi:putative oxidoreductase